jgi:hypothetical protein
MLLPHAQRRLLRNEAIIDHVTLGGPEIQPCLEPENGYAGQIQPPSY